MTGGISKTRELGKNRNLSAVVAGVKESMNMAPASSKSLFPVSSHAGKTEGPQRGRV